jgi:hypothetical protein
VGAIVILFAAMRATSREFYDGERITRPRVRDHVRHAALLYLIAIALVTWALLTRPMDMFAITVFFPSASLIGIIADYSVWQRRRRVSIESANAP